MRKRFLKTPVVISVGKNKYKHPSPEVIDFFNRQVNYELKRTDDYKILSNSEHTLKLCKLLDLVSDEVIPNLSEGDKVFKISNSEIEILK